MNVRFSDRDLERVFLDPAYSGHWAEDIVKSFRKRIQFIQQALDERDFYGMKSLHYEKLQGKRSRQRSMRLNDQLRLLMHMKTEDDIRTIVIDSIEDYH